MATAMARRRFGAVAFLLALFVLVGPPFAGAVRAETTPLIIRTDQADHGFEVELATTPEERAQGLMYRRSLDPDAGMLFDFGHERPVSMWMRNTYIPLDMVFIKADGRITNIIERAEPHSESPRPSSEPVRFVLELPGGTAERLDIGPGDEVDHPLMTP